MMTVNLFKCCNSFFLVFKLVMFCKNSKRQLRVEKCRQYTCRVHTYSAHSHCRYTLCNAHLLEQRNQTEMFERSLQRAVDWILALLLFIGLYWYSYGDLLTSIWFKSLKPFLMEVWGDENTEWGMVVRTVLQMFAW